MKLPLYCLAIALLLFAINNAAANNTATNITVIDSTVTHSQARTAYSGFDTPSALITVNNIDASVSEHLDRINLLNYQFPNQAQLDIKQIKKAAKLDLLTIQEKLRLELLQCYNLLERGESKAAIEKARLGESNAKKQKLDYVRAYFILCEAEAYFQNVELVSALPLVDMAIELAREHQQAQALINGLTLRADMDMQIDNYNSVMDDLRLALDIYSQATEQEIHWHLIPEIFITAAMSNFFFSTGDTSQALFYLDKIKASKDTVGKIELSVYKTAAIMSLNNNDGQLTDLYLARAKNLMAHFKSPQTLAHNHGVLAYIHLARNRVDEAEKEILMSIELLSKMDNPILLVRAQRTLAKIRFRQGRDREALIIMDDIISVARNLEQEVDLQEFYSILSQYHASKAEYQAAYEYQVERFDLEKKIVAKVNQARFLQFKARLNQHSELTHKASKNSVNQTYLTLQQTYGLIAVGLSLLFASLLFFIKKEPKLNSLTKPVEQQGGEIDTQLLSAKRGGYPLSLLLLNISDVRLVDLGDLQIHLLQTLREQDKLYRHSIDEMIILLPHTSLLGAQRVAKQLSVSIKDWQEASNITIGVASLQQLENLEQLVKKATLDQLSKKNNRAN
jgi:tetratricopeptide (TPR) repeat protein